MSQWSGVKYTHIFLITNFPSCLVLLQGNFNHHVQSGFIHPRVRCLSSDLDTDSELRELYSCLLSFNTRILVTNLKNSQKSISHALKNAKNIAKDNNTITPPRIHPNACTYQIIVIHELFKKIRKSGNKSITKLAQA